MCQDVPCILQWLASCCIIFSSCWALWRLEVILVGGICLISRRVLMLLSAGMPGDRGVLFFSCLVLGSSNGVWDMWGGVGATRDGYHIWCIFGQPWLTLLWSQYWFVQGWHSHHVGSLFWSGGGQGIGKIEHPSSFYDLVTKLFNKSHIITLNSMGWGIEDSDWLLAK